MGLLGLEKCPAFWLLKIVLMQAFFSYFLSDIVR